MTTHFLHRELREKGGAYGGGARYSSMDGLFQLMSYRDPLGYIRTLTTFDQAVEWAINLEVSAEELEQAKLDVLKSLDAPINASQEGLATFQSGIPFEVIKAQRVRLFEASVDDIKLAATALFRGKNSSICVIGEAFSSPII